MAFATEANHGNLPNGVWSPTMFATEVLEYFRRGTVAEAVTNTDYSGDATAGAVKIIKEPVITVRDLKRGTVTESQDINDEDLTLAITEGKYFQFEVDDIEKALSHVDWMSKSAASGADSLKQAFDTDVLQYMADNATTNSTLGVAASPKTVGTASGKDYTPLKYLNRLNTLLNENDIPADGRFVVVNAAFIEMLGDEDSKYIDAATMGVDKSSVLDNGLAFNAMPYGFKIYMTNNSPTDASSNATVLCGHISSTATATALTTTESFRSQTKMADVVRQGLIWGREVLRPEALFVGSVTIGN